jgi:membrane fusion protein, adhesin transport system
MLNISNKSISSLVAKEQLKSLQEVESYESKRVILRVLTVLFVLLVVMMFLPWNQNIQSQGNVTTLKPNQRPQMIHSIIAGRIEKWYVQEGDFVAKGDTILFISEVKDEYFDPNLLSRTQQQLQSKEQSVSSYKEKVRSLDDQIKSLIQGSKLKVEQARNKLEQTRLKAKTDSIDYQAYVTNFEIAKEQFARTEKLHNNGLKSKTDLEDKKLKMQKAQAEMISAQNKLMANQNELTNAKVELSSIKAQYEKDIAKAESDKFTAMSGMYDAEATVTKLQNQYSNYSMRSGLYYIKAPQDGYITKTMISGIGETVKEGEKILSIMPANYDLAVEMYVKPIDLPLLEKGQHVRIQFDGWPAIVFSGWPNTSYGTYGGIVYAIDNFISDNGKYRVMVAPDPNDHPWPEALRVGAGTHNMLLLKDVPIWYELWRHVNGFPPDYYKVGKADKAKETKKS